MKVFKEEQRFTQWWLWLLLGGLNLLFLFGAYQQLIAGKSFGNNPMSDVGLIVFIILFLCFTSSFYFVKLETKIDEYGVHYKFYPLHLKFKTISWEEIESINIIKYRPIAEHGGWGLKGNAVNVKGNIGIQIYLKTKQVKLIGTQKENEAKQVLANYKAKIIAK